jgi:CheY-like chemotaxis protein
MFDLFAQGEHVHQPRREGLGIGLALARMLVELHGGSIAAASAGLGCGTRFEIRLPIADAAPTFEAAKGSAPILARPGRDVVIIDDNRDAANALAALVGALGGRAHVAYDSITGIARIFEVRPDLVLLDIGMPGIDGYETCRRIRNELADQDLVIVAISGWGAPEHKARAMAAGFTAHLTKPADVMELRRLVIG